MSVEKVGKSRLFEKLTIKAEFNIEIEQLGEKSWQASTHNRIVNGTSRFKALHNLLESLFKDLYSRSVQTDDFIDHEEEQALWNWANEDYFAKPKTTGGALEILAGSSDTSAAPKT